MDFYDEDESMDDAYDPDLFEEFGEGFEDDFDAVSEKSYEEAFDRAKAEEEGKSCAIDEKGDEYEYDSVVGGRDKKPVMSILNKGKLSKYEMDDLLNSIE
ncbi:MAG: hypothetical protein ACLFTH_01230 [Candidatus Woesearchaeota archaeon]